MSFKLFVMKPIIRFAYMHSQDFRIAVVVAQERWRAQKDKP